ncbi:hypothetical protein QE152_g9941 [Popillia japonica]|uniref:Transposable element P transposase-like GTP-binding insertion domain-containing protein n=1 Tax=Popillia japonica TaxID=7064 RepID=A0AAW1LXT0_POPJA
MQLTKEDLMLQKSYMKMRVCVAARTLRYTMAAALETFSVSTFSSDALHTAQFVEQVDKLFDSVNGRTPYPEKGKDMRACVSRTSKHRDFWYSMLKKIRMWNFFDRNGKKVTAPRCKMGWIQSIEGFHNDLGYMQTKLVSNFLGQEQ